MQRSKFTTGQITQFPNLLQHHQSYDQSKWDLARDASLDAINAALENGVSLYEFTSTPPNYEDEYEDEEFIQTLYDLKYSIVDKWNSELILSLIHI